MRKLDSRPGCILQTDDAHKYIVATQKGIELTSFDESQENVLLLQRIDMEKKELNRFNDGKVDPTGR
jgi:sugar lactone lactonase YvrE